MTDSDCESFHHQIEARFYGQRLDQVAAQVFSGYSRARLQSWIKSGQLRVDGLPAKPKNKVYGGEILELNATSTSEDRWQPQAIALDIIYSDEHIVVINKPAGLVVHPGAGVADGTLLNGLLHYFPELAAIPRAGIVHRLDKDTSGLMVVARSLLAHHSLVKQLQGRNLGREYQAIVMGELTGGGTINKPLGRHPGNRLKRTVLADSTRGKEAITHYRLLQRFTGYTHISCRLETGRTHQIRVHMAHIHHPLVGDPVYLGRQKWRKGSSESLKHMLINFNRQALHAYQLTLIHPHTGKQVSWQVELPEDMQTVLSTLAIDESDKRDRHKR